MTAFEITEIRDFMNRLLKTPLFDHFLLAEAAISTAVTWQIDGTMHADFFAAGTEIEKGYTGLPCVPFSLMRGSIFSIIKGKNAPLSFQFVFQLSPENTANTLRKSSSGLTPADVSAMFINLNYRNKKLLATTGISYKTFTLDKTLEKEWDALAQKFFRINGIPITPV